VNSPDRPSSWFNALSKPQQVTAIVMSLIGSIGGAAYLMFEPLIEPAAFFLILAYTLLSLMVLGGIPRVHLWFGGRGYLLYLGVFGVLKGASGELETPAIRVSTFVIGVLLLTYLIVRAVRIEWGKRQTDHAKA
jgi:ABC-type branched-subunit amino acid transport system permease subunit